MPTPEQILAGLQQLSTEYLYLATVWHVLFGIAITALLLGYRPSRQLTAAALSLPLLSVAILAWIVGNPFNGIVFSVLGIALLVIGLRMQGVSVDVERKWMLTGSGLIIFGWIYPHFFSGNGIWHFIATAPLGLVPCPTLSMLIGVTLVFGGFASRSWMRVLGAAGVFYGAFGAFRLGVKIDLVLLAAALLLLYISIRPASITHEQTA